MLAESLTALAAALGTAVVQAAGTQAWDGFRTGVARVLGRGEGDRESVELERLDRTAAALRSATPERAELERTRQETAWETRLAVLLEELAEPERDAVVAGLETLLAERRTEQGGPTAGGGVVSGNTFHDRANVQAGYVNVLRIDQRPEA
ncbi:hypothetical protein ACFPM3_11360 [Streptomyces coeruleoprunus]|uniref:Uncharacterized protein n=1 Tax=Streptomyces coeruleoprunus TaxID=285563 RepID=A0ABV9XB92_9ACTN